MTALLVSAAGNCIVNVPSVVVKSPPKSKTHTAESVASPSVAAPPDDCYISAHRAVVETVVKEVSAKSAKQIAVEELPVTPLFVSVFPAAV